MRIFGFTSGRRFLGTNLRQEIAPDEIFLDSHNLPNLDVQQFEGRLERPISKSSVLIASFLLCAMGTALLSRAWVLQIRKGEAYSILSQRNSLRQTIIFAPRGLIVDRNNMSLVSNKASTDHSEYPSRQYLGGLGFAHLLGYVEYPKKDTSGAYYREEFAGKEGVEAYYNELLAGQNGKKITEKNVAGVVESESLIDAPRYGDGLTLSVDARLQNKLYAFMRNLSVSRGFTGGAVAIMDIKNGELVAVTSFPEFDSTVMSEGSDTATIKKYLSDDRQPFLDRAVTGLYTPGSIVKPFLALGALSEGVIDPLKKILSTGSISIPNPFDPKKKSVFTDWRPQGWVDMREALAVSSNVYFYEVGGGFEGQPGLGIANIEKYLRLFGFGQTEQNNFLLNVNGTIPDPKWKELNFDGEQWRIGDTYNTAIGQYGVQVTPLQMVRAIGAIANDGMLVKPTVLKNGNEGNVNTRDLGFSPEQLAVVKEGMRDAVLFGTAKNLDIPQMKLAAKTGTAELGSKKQFVNSWVIGFFPYDAPRYAFAALMERGPHDNTVGALYIMRQFFEWLPSGAPEYLK